MYEPKGRTQSSWYSVKIYMFQVNILVKGIRTSAGTLFLYRITLSAIIFQASFGSWKKIYFIFMMLYFAYFYQLYNYIIF